MDMLSRPPYAALVEGARTEGVGGLAICFPCCRCKAADRKAEDLHEQLWHAENELAILRDDARISSGIRPRQQARDEVVRGGKVAGDPAPGPSSLASLRDALDARYSACMDRLAVIWDGAALERGETTIALVTSAEACRFAMGRLGPYEALLGEVVALGGTASVVAAVRRGTLGFLRDEVERRFSGAGEVLAMADEAAGV